MDEKMMMLCDKDVWQKVLDKAVDKRKDKVILSYIANPAGRLAIVEAINDGRYKFQPPRTMYIDKKTGNYITREQAEHTEKVRELYKNEVMDSVVLSVINDIYYKMYGHMIHRNCLSYQKGIGVKDIIHGRLIPRLKSGQHGYKMDISKYFDRVNQSTLDALLTSISTDSPVDKVIWDLYHDDRVYLGKDDFTTERYMGFRQGNPIATFLANIGLKDIDDMADGYDVLYLRYSDDILVLGPDADEVKANIEKMLLPKGLELNPKKVEPVDSDHTFTFLGCKITGNEVDISDDAVAKFKRQVKLITKPRKSVQKKSRTSQKRAIKKINNILRNDYIKDGETFGFEPYYYSIITTDKTVRMLDEYCKDHIKVVYTGDWNHTRAMHNTSNEQLMELGWLSMIHMQKLWHCGRDVYESQMRMI